MVGALLVEEIESRAKTCQLAIFILTKEDLGLDGVSMHLALRDN
jgi:hypothetical protein